MQKPILFCGIDVDDKTFTGALISECGKQEFEFRTRPSVGALEKKLREFEAKGFELKVCYEAGFLGFSLYRDLIERGICCKVIAPSLIPTLAGKQTKTDRLDSRKIANFFRNGLLTEIYIPEESEERVRDFIRSRKFITQQLKSLRTHILFQCRRMRLDYRASGETQKAQYWTKTHLLWLDRETNKLEDAHLKINLSQLLTQMRFLESQIALYDEEIEKIASTEVYQSKVEALCCYRGISTLTAMTLISEIGNVKRFKHPKFLTSYAGMDLREYSSGGRELKFSMTKLGNKHIRTAVIESSQLAWNIPRVSRELNYRRGKISPKYIEVADRCMNRLYKKSVQLLARGKSRNKVKTACARELLCFVWESLNMAA